MKTISNFFSLGLLLLQSTLVFASSDLQPSYDFLVNTKKVGGALYVGSAGELQGRLLPLSYYDTPAYWGEFVCEAAKHNRCEVTDTFNPYDYSLLPIKSDAGDLQVERINVHNGTDIYDAATWQIAVMLGHVRNHFKLPPSFVGDAYSDLVNNQNRLLHLGYDGNATRNSLSTDANRGITNGSIYRYNTHSVNEAKSAYFFRMVTRNWLSSDPLSFDSHYAGLITATDLPADNPNYQKGKVSWQDWKPITGENAWAFLIGPLQAAYLHYVVGEQQKAIPFNDLSIQNALAILPTFAAMQSKIGAIYYVPSGTLGNQGSQLVNPYTVSVENNISLYAGLTILKQTLLIEQTEAENLSLNTLDLQRIKNALTMIDSMLTGGVLALADGSTQETAGLIDFFKTKAWQDGAFIQGGLANDPAESEDWVVDVAGPKAVDVTTWGIAALGTKQIDNWFGQGAAYRAWQKVKSFGAYGEGNVLMGVGYSDQDGNGLDAAGHYQQGILSAEWTAGAINMVHEMIAYYQQQPASEALIQALKTDENSMLNAIEQLKLTNYRSEKVVLSGKPDNYKNLFESEQYAPYLYASKRYLIPFGWYANPIPSTCSTAWMIMAADHFNPFVYGG